MLKRAYKHSTEINDFILDYNNREYLKYYIHGYFDEIKVPMDEWSGISCVSVRGDEILGFISAAIDRTSNNVSSLSIINMTKKPDQTFARDLLSFIDELFTVYKFGKIGFYCYIGNPAEKQYDKAIKKLGGRIVGVREKDQRLYDGTVVDQKIYEILSENYRRTFFMKLQCKACSKRCVRNYEDNTCPDGKTADFKAIQLKSRPGVYNARKVRI